MNRIWVLGASDPEMSAIETILRRCDETVIYALDAVGRRVHAGNMYRAAPPQHGAMRKAGEYTVLAVECAFDGETGDVATIDHHRPGDPGFGRPPAEFVEASSIGQVILALSQMDRLPDLWHSIWAGEYGVVEGLSDGIVFEAGRYVVGDHVIPRDYVLTAAADHCLAAAYRGECPGVDPDELAEWRVRSRAEFQGVDADAIRSAIDAVTAELRAAATITLGDVCVRDMRREQPIPELPEAACRLGMAYIAGPLRSPDGRTKYTVSGPREVIEAWPAWAAEHGIVDCYGDPLRGFAGGYATQHTLGWT